MKFMTLDQEHMEQMKSLGSELKGKDATLCMIVFNGDDSRMEAYAILEQYGALMPKFEKAVELMKTDHGKSQMIVKLLPDEKLTTTDALYNILASFETDSFRVWFLRAIKNTVETIDGPEWDLNRLLGYFKGNDDVQRLECLDLLQTSKMVGSITKILNHFKEQDARMRALFTIGLENVELFEGRHQSILGCFTETYVLKMSLANHVESSDERIKTRRDRESRPKSSSTSAEARTTVRKESPAQTRLRIEQEQNYSAGQSISILSGSNINGTVRIGDIYQGGMRIVGSQQ